MTVEQWSLVQTHFATLSELSADAWPDGLASIHDEHVRAEVATLLEHTEGASETIGDIIGCVTAELQVEAEPGRRIGPFRVIRRLGAGGQGAVFEAVRDDGAFDQRVAIKVIKWEMDTPAARLQFRNERQILAGLTHPAIARLLDGGETENGVPYIVMEFIDGVPITERVEAWTLRRKLELFLQVADAVAYAHRNLVIHRDLKPGNILVTSDGTPKVLDFGIARLIGKDSTKTSTGLWALTPGYASPEQISGLTISTASDVYSLGVVLYELLTGRKPYDTRLASPTEMMRVVCHEMPAPPKLGDELDHIVLMALRKEPERRYSSVQHFGDDLRRLLAEQPVLAKPDTWSYRTRKFVRRHASVVMVFGLLFLTLAGGVITSQYQARRAQHRFEQLRHLANTFVFDVDDSVRNLAGSTSARQLIVKTGLEYLDNLAAEAGSDFALKLELAGAYPKIADVLGSPSEANLGRASEAIENYRKSRKLLEQVIAEQPGNVEALRQLAYVAPKVATLYLIEGSKQAGSESLETGRRAIVQARSAGINDAYLEFLDGGIFLRQGDAIEEKSILEAMQLFQEAVARYQRAVTLQPLPRYRRGVSIAFSRIARMQLDYGQVRAAVTSFEEALNVSRQLSLENPADQAMQRGYAVALMNSADAQGLPSLFSLGDTTKALRLYGEALRIHDRLLAGDSKSVLSATDALLVRNRIGAILATSNPSEAIKVLDQALRLIPLLGATVNRPNIQLAIGMVHLRLAIARMARGENEAALQEARKAVSMLEPLSAAVPAYAVLGDAMKAFGQPREAVQTWEKAVLKVDGLVRLEGMDRQDAVDIREAADLLERLADNGANSCVRYQQAAKLWDVCIARGAPAGQSSARLLSKMRACGR